MKDLINAVTGTEIASVLEATNTHKHSRQQCGIIHLLKNSDNLHAFVV